MKIITISREFGSGGRELGKRMSDILNIPYYDKEIVAAVAQELEMDEGRLEKALARPPMRGFPITIGRTFSYPAYHNAAEINMLVSRQNVIKKLATQGDCIIMGQGADWILREYRPLNLFVYADTEAKLRRCMERAPENEHLDKNEMLKKMKQIDASRAKRYELISSHKWGQKERYHMCVSTEGLQIKALAPQIAEYARYWFRERWQNS